MSSFAYSIDQISELFESANELGQLRKDWLKLDGEEGESLYCLLAQKQKEIRAELKKEKRRKREDRNDDLLIDLNDKLELASEERQNIEEKIKEDILKNVTESKFHIKIKKEYNKDMGKYMYVTGDCRNSFFACKIINNELQKALKIVQPNRNKILQGLKLLLSEPMDKMFVRCDIKSFFESIPRDKLMEKLERTGLISSKTLRLIRKMFVELSMTHSYTEGVPRGISFSPILADFYLRDIDVAVASLPGVYYYQRYVDDIVVIASPTPNIHRAAELFEKIKEIFKEVGLSLHEQDEDGKYMASDILYKKEGTLEFEYLGYHVILNKMTAKVAFLLKEAKVEKYCCQIDKSIAHYIQIATHNPRKDNKGKKVATNVARRRQPLSRLYKMLNYLTANYHLGGTKHEILSGIYYKHEMLTDISQLTLLDKYLYDSIENIDHKRFASFAKGEYWDNVKKSLHERFSFVEGFQQRRMCYMTSSDFKMIKHILNHEA